MILIIVTVCENRGEGFFLMDEGVDFWWILMVWFCRFGNYV